MKPAKSILASLSPSSTLLAFALVLFGIPGAASWITGWPFWECVLFSFVVALVTVVIVTEFLDQGK